jgi:hypothetical protein
VQAARSNDAVKVQYVQSFLCVSFIGAPTKQEAVTWSRATRLE